MSQPASDATAAAYRRKVYAKLIIFVILMLIVWLQPKVTAWLENRKAGGTGGSDVVANNDSASTGTAQVPSSRSKVVIKDVNEPVIAEVDRTDSESTPPPVVEAPDASDSKAATEKSRPATSKSTKSKSAASKSSKKKSEADAADVAKSDAGKSDAKTSDAAKPDTSTSNTTKSAKASSSAEKSSLTKAGSSSTRVETKVADSDSPNSEAKKNSGSGTIRMDREDASKRRTAGGEPTTSKDATATPPKTAATSADKSQKDTPALGELREIRDYVFESTAGLLYVKGSTDGHRLKHVMQHAKDDLSKPKHGVFEGDRDQILAVIDEAYEKTKKGGKDVQKSDEDGRTVYIVNLGRKIGYVGGQSGERTGNPDCRYVQLVLEDENVVVTAYPTKSF